MKGIRQLARSVKTNDRKVLLSGDSHAKNCVLEFRHNLDYNYEVFIKPESLASEIIKAAKKEVASLKQEEVLILWTEANDISRNNYKDVKKWFLLDIC